LNSVNEAFHGALAGLSAVFGSVARLAPVAIHNAESVRRGIHQRLIVAFAVISFPPQFSS